MPYSTHIEKYHQEVSYLQNLDKILKDDCNNRDEYVRILKKTKYLLIFTEFQRALRKILKDLCQQWQRLQYVPTLKKCYYGYIIKRTNSIKHKYDISKQFDLLIKLEESNYYDTEFFTQLNQSFSILPSSWKTLNDLLVETLFIQMPNIQYAINEDSDDLMMNTKQNYTTEEVFNAFITLRVIILMQILMMKK